MFRRIAILTAALAALALGASAAAQAWDDPFSDRVSSTAHATSGTPNVLPKDDQISMTTFRRWARESVKIGVRYWHSRGKRPCTSPRMTTMNYFDDQTIAQMVKGRMLGVTARSRRATCLIAWNRRVYRRLTWGMLCKVTVHEMGHSAGLVHSWNPDKVMNATPNDHPFAPCTSRPAPSSD